MSYQRVIPRDLFNEANLLKCYGALWIAIEGHRTARFSESDMENFSVAMRESDGWIYIKGLFLLVGSRRFRLTRPCNSRDPFPLYAEAMESDAEPVAVFNDDGTLAQEFWELISTKETHASH